MSLISFLVFFMIEWSKQNKFSENNTYSDLDNSIKESLSKKFKQLLKSKTSLEENLNLILHQVLNLLFELLIEEHKINLGQVLIIWEHDILFYRIFECHHLKI